MAEYQVRTVSGKDFYEVSSAFQKCIRRGLEEKAMYWAVELYESNYSQYVWKRMIIMASEDVGLADPLVIVQIMALKQSFEYLSARKEKSKPERLPFTHAVVLLSRAMKSRYIDHRITVSWHQNANEDMAFDDWVFDSHTRAGKAKGRGEEFFYSDSAYIVNANKLDGEEELEKKAMQCERVYGVTREDEPCMDEERKNAKPSYIQGRLF